jgi:hypothetical protein
MHALIKISASTSTKVKGDSNEKVNRIIVVREIPAAPCDNNTAHICTMLGGKCDVCKCYSNNFKVRDLLTIITKHMLPELYNLQPRQSTTHP